MAQGALLDLVCGPTSPLPETYQRYRLVAHLGSGGQADVYRAVRLCGGVSSAPMTVKVFRVDPQRPIADELRSWDKGDAALMDLNNRGVAGICRRADGFYGPPPHRPGERPAPGDAVPYQIYDYLHGVNLREYVVERSGQAPGARRLNALVALRTLSGVLKALHHPQESGATPVLHMDVKPSNLMVLTNGDVRLIDFTGARYFREEEITQIAYTPESGGPEAFGGVRYMGPAYDVHGFGAVAYFLVTGAYPRESASAPAHPSESSPPPWSVLRRHPMLERVPQLRDHLHAPLADRPADRPETRELDGWLSALGDLVRRFGVPDVGVDWQEPDRLETARIIGRATPRPAVTGTETDAYQRIERLERELVELRALAQPAPPKPGPYVPPTRMAPVASMAPTSGAASMAPVASMAPTSGGVAPGSSMVATAVGMPPAPGVQSSGAPISGAPTSGAPTSGAPTSGAPGGGARQMRGRARVVPKPAPDPTGMIDAHPPADAERWRPPPGDRARQLKIGWELTGTGAIIAFVCWGVWAMDQPGRLTGPLVAFLLVLVVAAGVFALARLVGRLVLEERLNRPRRSAKAAHAVTGVFLTAAGLAYLQQVGWIMNIVGWLGDNAW